MIDLIKLTELVNQGLSTYKIAEKMGFSQSNISYHIRKNKIKYPKGRAFKLDITKEELQEAVNLSTTKADVLKYFGMRKSGSSYKVLDRRLLLFEIDTSHFKGFAHGKSNKKINLSEILVKNSTYVNSSQLGKRLVEEGYLIYECSKCGIDKWMNEVITLEIDHINGYRNDNRLENLRYLCPNCHSQTDTFGNKKRIDKS